MLTTADLAFVLTLPLPLGFDIGQVQQPSKRSCPETSHGSAPTARRIIISMNALSMFQRRRKAKPSKTNPGELRIDDHGLDRPASPYGGNRPPGPPGELRRSFEPPLRRSRAMLTRRSSFKGDQLITTDNYEEPAEELKGGGSCHLPPLRSPSRKSSRFQVTVSEPPEQVIMAKCPFSTAGQ